MNPSGRFGAPATEPGPSGMAEEFMTVSFSRLAGQEVVRVGGTGELLADQPGQQQQCAPRPVVPHDVQRLPGGVAFDYRDVADRLAADAGGVVLEPAVLAVWAGEVELLVVIEPANGNQYGSYRLRTLDEAVHRRAFQGDVVGQVVQPRRIVIGELRLWIAASHCHRLPPRNPAAGRLPCAVLPQARA